MKSPSQMPSEPLGRALENPATSSGGAGLVEVCNRARNDSSLPGDAMRNWFWKSQGWSSNLGKLTGKLRVVEWMRLAS